jgi:tetratricopeptide (TPR) repeat protein
MVPPRAWQSTVGAIFEEHGLGLFSFGKKKPADQPQADAPAAPAAGGAAPVAGAFVAQPDKARKFFDHAKTIAQTGNYEYALMLYAKGFRFDPSGLPRHEEFYKLAVSFYQSGGKPAGKEEIRELDGPGPIDKFVQAEYIWARDVLNMDAAFRMLETAGKAGQIEFGGWIAPRLLDLLRKQKKQSKSMWLKAKTLFTGVEAYGEAFACVEEAVRVDPSDTQLSADLKELTARHAIKQGGYDKAVGGGGNFTSMVKDSAKQQQLQEQNQIAASEETEARNLERARKDFEDNPMSADAILKLGTILRRRATEESENEAHAVFMTGFERLSEYRFRMFAGEIRVSQMRRRVNAAEKRAEANPADSAARAEFDGLRRELLELERVELREKQKNYPTDRSIKAELGRIEFELGNYEDAMAAFQACKDEAKLRIGATHMLGRCFAAEGWHSEASSEYREALSALGAGESERELPIKYDLMVALMELAKSERNGTFAREAGEICSAIVRKDISYRDIRTKRKEIDALVKELPA